MKKFFFYKTKFNHSDYGDYVRRLGTKISILNNANVVSYLDADNDFEKDHFHIVYETHKSTGKSIIISERNFYKNGILINVDKNQDFFDTNQITLFGNKIKIGLLWGRYPNELSLIGDRIITNYIKKFHSNDIAFTNKKTVNYNYSSISKDKIESFKRWYLQNYVKHSTRFRSRFGFDIELEPKNI